MQMELKVTVEVPVPAHPDAVKTPDFKQNDQHRGTGDQMGDGTPLVSSLKCSCCVKE